MKQVKKLLFLVIFLLSATLASYPCTNFLVSRGASADGSVMISYAADSHVLYGELYRWPAADWAKGSMLDVHEWDTGKYLGQISQIAHTYSVIGNMNEHQLSIGETTYGGRPELHNADGLIDYGSLIYITLQRAKTAREAILTMVALCDEYGYYSSGESFSIADPNEVWIMEVIGKGRGEKGLLWVARRVPDGYVSAHANQARITTFPLDDKENCLYGDDVISFAREQGWYKGKDKDFSFRDTYAPLSFGGLRYCEARVWSFFNKVNNNMDQYIDYAMGRDARNPMPLFIKPDHKITAQDMMAYMGDHYEGTPMDMTTDLGAGAFGLPYRWRPLTWEVDGVTYCNERAISTQQTGFSFIAQSRSWLPDPIGGIFWFGVDDAATTVYVPMYCGILDVPNSFREGNGDMLVYSDDAAFWAFNRVSNMCYLRYNLMVKDVKKVQKEYTDKFAVNTRAIDKAAQVLYSQSPSLTREFLTGYSQQQADAVTARWKKLGNFLLVKYMDGNIKQEKDGVFIDNGTGVAVHPDQPGYNEKWKKAVARDAGEKLKVVETKK